MTCATPVMVISGVPYEVVAVCGHAPGELDELVGATTLVLQGPTGRHDVVGEGCLDADEEGVVRVHEKTADGGKDVRTWRVRRVDDGAMTAATT